MAPAEQPMKMAQIQPAAPLPIQTAEIQYAPRRQPDLSKLKALFKAPVFSRG
jgi:hypothetical protein